MAAETSERPVTLCAAFVSIVVIAIAKFLAALIARSSAMLAEVIHSFVDVGNKILLLFGINRSKRLADEQHPFGYGKETYF